MKTKQIMILLFIILLLFVRCDTTEPPQSKATLTLELEDVSCTEAWIKLTTTNLPLPTSINLLKNNVVSQVFILNTQDSLLYIDSLLPKQTYTYQVSSIQNPASNAVAISNALSVTTMDTTSHNFAWQTFTFGEHSSSVLYDVAIINENNIWAVGEIYMNDSLGNIDPNFYNLIKWNGTEWKPERIYFVNSQGQSFLAPMKSIFAFNANDIWIGLDQIIRWNGNKYQSIEIPNAVFHSWINKLWGSSSSDLYAVGNGGNIAHYQNGVWKKIESGTTTRINDIWGIVTRQNKMILYCPVASFFVPGDKKILKIVDGKVDSVSWNRDVRLYSAWAQDEKFLFTCGEGAYVNKFGIWGQINISEVGTNSIRGNNINDIFIVGDYGFIAHFNGTSWNVEENDFNAGYGSLSIKGNTVAVVGQRNGMALIKIGKRN